MDLTKPINVNAVIGAVKEHRGLLTSLDAESASSILQHMTPIPGVKDSITLGRTTLAKVSRKYTGQFVGTKEGGTIVPRTLTVYPCVMEMDDEPERYRRTYITEVKGGLTTHPFEIWLINYGIKCASKELHDDMLLAKLDNATNKTSLADSFDGLMTIVNAEVTANKITTELGNKYATGAFTRADIGDKLLAMYRHMPMTFRNKEGQKLYMAADLADMYDDWLNDQGYMVLDRIAETTGQKFLRGTNGKLEIVRLTNLPEGSQFVMMTSQLNVVYGYDEDSDFQNLVPFESGNPYHFTAYGKYVIGFQFVSIDKSEFCINDQPVTPVKAG